MTQECQNHQYHQLKINIIFPNGGSRLHICLKENPQRKCGHIKTGEPGLVLWAAFGEGKERNIGVMGLSFEWFYFASSLMSSF